MNSPNSLLLTLLLFAYPVSPTIAETEKPAPPNFILIFADDLGYQDLGCYGAPLIKTPNIDRMASQGMRFTSFYAQTVCGPSRAALMTGFYPLRIATENNRVDVHPYMHPKEVTIAETLKQVGYATAVIGKWDLAGHTQDLERYSRAGSPNNQGFDLFFGTPSSNDNRVNLMRNQELLEEHSDMSQLTRRYTEAAIDFIKQNNDRPFFIYVPHTMPHIRLEVSDAFKGKSAGGLYGDVIEELDWSVGEILDTLRKENLEDNTYVFFMSDNGPWYLGRSQGHIRRIGPEAEAHGGSAAPLRGAKTSTWEGGLRVPCVMWAPGNIPPGTVYSDIATTMDMHPTIAELAGASLPTDRVIDGRSIESIIHGAVDTQSPTEAFYYYRRTRLEAVRVGKWKLHLPYEADEKWGYYSKASDDISIVSPTLYDLDADVSETTDVASQHPDIVTNLLQSAEHARADIGDIDRVGVNARFFDPDPKRPDIASN